MRWLAHLAALACMVLGTVQAVQGYPVTAGLAFTSALLLEASSRYEKRLDERKGRHYRG
jgi:hypothetical protein